MSYSSRPTAPSRFGGLDGLRAIAVGLVLVYHLFPGILIGGFLGVDVFFVISGFLITSLLLQEQAVTGHIRLRVFWRRRARRLLPALGLVLLVCTALGLAVGGDVLVDIGGQLLGAALFVSNWVFVAQGADYFAHDTPELFRNTWSLSIEEQFYVALPLLLLLLVRMRSRAVRVAVFTGLGALSAALMWIMSLVGADTTRIYFGSDTHVFGLLLGVALACALRGGAEPTARLGWAKQIGLLAVTILGLAALGWLAVTLGEGSAQSFQGGFQLATLAALVTVWAITRRGSWAGIALDIQPLRWIGQRSYGIYLWHWPLLVLLSGIRTPWDAAPAKPWVVGAVTLILTTAIAALSYSYIEQPIRRIGLRRSARLLLRPWRLSTPRQRVTAAGLAIVIAATVPATAVAVSHAPEETSAEEAIARGQESLEKQGPGETGAPNDQGTEGDSEGTQPPQGEGFGSSGSSSEDGSTGPTEVRPEGQDISAVGDSVMLASAPELDTAFPGIWVDAAVSRGLGAGVGIYNEQAAQGTLRRVLVVGLGTNGPVQIEELEALRQTAGDRPIVLVNAHADRDWIPGVNTALSDYAATHRGVVLADWDGAITPRPDALAGDGIHPHSSGGELYADAVQQALQELEEPGEAIGYSAPRR